MSRLFSADTADEVIIDSVLRESWDEDYAVPTQPVDGRSPVNEHLQEKPRGLRLVCRVTETPSSEKYARFPVGGRARITTARDQLRTLRKGQLFNFLSVRTGTTTNLALEKMSYLVETAGKVDFVLSFTEVSLVFVETAAVPPERKRTKKLEDKNKKKRTAPLNGVPRGESFTRSALRSIVEAFNGVTTNPNSGLGTQAESGGNASLFRRQGN